MELMSSLLLCALTSLLAPTLGRKANLLPEIRRDTTKIIEAPIPRKTIWLSSKLPSRVTLTMVLQTMQMDLKCMKCINCMIKAIKILNSTDTTHYRKYMPSRDAIMNDVFESYHQYKTSRIRREAEIQSSPEPKKTHQVSKSKNVTITKYNIDGQVYAIKIRERNTTEKNQNDQTCQVYSVKKYYPCNSPKADLIFATAKRKANKRSKKLAKTTLTTEQPKSTEAPLHGASRAKSLAEPFMTSIEELYN